MTCRVYQGASRMAVLAWWRKHPEHSGKTAIRCMFDSLEDMWGWIGDHLKPVRVAASVVWLTDKSRRVKDGQSFYVQRDDWLGYRWDLMPDEVLVQEIFLRQKGFSI